MRILLLTWNMGIIDPHGICCAWYLLRLTQGDCMSFLTH